MEGFKFSGDNLGTSFVTKDYIYLKFRCRSCFKIRKVLRYLISLCLLRDTIQAGMRGTAVKTPHKGELLEHQAQEKERAFSKILSMGI